MLQCMNIKQLCLIFSAKLRTSELQLDFIGSLKKKECSWIRNKIPNRFLKSSLPFFQEMTYTTVLLLISGLLVQGVDVVVPLIYRQFQPWRTGSCCSWVYSSRSSVWTASKSSTPPPVCWSKTLAKSQSCSTSPPRHLKVIKKQMLLSVKCF